MFLFTLVLVWIIVEFFRFHPPRGILACGIYGFSGARPVDVTKLKWLAVENQSRGTDSTGVYGNHLYKERGPAKSVILSPGFNSAIKGSRTVQGHDRAASPNSAITQDNSHPFMFGHEEMAGIDWKATVVGAHNGFIIPEMLDYHEKEFGFKVPFRVDSQVIFAALAKTKDINVISKIEASMAISFQFVDDDPNKLYLYRRAKTRPLWIGESSDGLYYSSLEDSLQYIGCRSIWEADPDILYTLKDGKIIDYYHMPLPRLKSLAVNVTRSNWRGGLPHAEVNALPINVTSHRTYPVYGMTQNKGGGFNQSRLGFGEGYEPIAPSKSAITNRMSMDYTKSGNTLDAKFNMLVHNINNELQKLEAVPVQTTSIIDRDPSFLSSCALVIKLKHLESGRGLVAWSILADGDPSLAGITSADGITVIKIPKNKCGHDEITLMAYAPVEEYGPYSFKIVPEAGRVLEVTLQIPFLKKGNKKKETDEVNVRTLNANVGGPGTAGTYCLLDGGIKSTGLHATSEGENSGILQFSPTQVLGGHTGREANGPLDVNDPCRTAVPTSDHRVSSDEYDRRRKNTLPMQPAHVQREMITVALLKDANGEWHHFKDMPLETQEFYKNSPGYKEWEDIYAANENMLGFALAHDAGRLMARDKYIYQCYYPIWVYIELLLRFKFELYYFSSKHQRKASELTEEQRAEYYPSNILKIKKNSNTIHTLRSKTELIHGRLPYLVSSGFIKYLLNINTVDNVTDKSIRALQEFKEKISDHISELSQMVVDQDTNSNLNTDQKNVIINSRNFLKLFRDDIETFETQCKAAYKSKQLDKNIGTASSE